MGNSLIALGILLVALFFISRPILRLLGFSRERAVGQSCLPRIFGQAVSLLVVVFIGFLIVGKISKVLAPGPSKPVDSGVSQPPKEQHKETFYWPLKYENGQPLGDYGELTFLTNTCLSYSNGVCSLYARHLGVDILVYDRNANSEVVPVERGIIHPIADGKVIDKKCDRSGNAYNNGLGYSILIEHNILRNDRKLHTMYLHMRDCSPLSVGDPVKGGETVLGYLGKTGFSFGSPTPHLHLEVPLFEGWGHPDNKYGGIIRYSYGYNYDSNPELYRDNWVDPATLISK